MQARTSTIIVAERPLLREGAVSLLHSSGYKVIATASQASEVEDLLKAPLGRALVIFGIAGANCDYDELAENVGLFRSLSPDIKIVVVAETPGAVDLQRILAIAPDGYIVNLSSREILLKALELTLLDQRIFVLGQQTAPAIADNPHRSHHRDMNGDRDRAAKVHAASQDGAETEIPALSPRELEVLVCVARGESNKQIARSCTMAESTVKVHLKTILRKLDAQNRTQAAIAAIARGLVGGEPADIALQPALRSAYAPVPDFGSFAGEAAAPVVPSEIAIS